MSRLLVTPISDVKANQSTSLLRQRILQRDHENPLHVIPVMGHLMQTDDPSAFHKFLLWKLEATQQNQFPKLPKQEIPSLRDITSSENLRRVKESNSETNLPVQPHSTRLHFPPNVS